MAFKKGCIAWNKGTKGAMPTPWNKGKKWPEMSGINNPMWKGGRYKDVWGYIWIYQPNHPLRDNRNYVREHRIVVEKQIGRFLKPKEMVHHLGKRDDNKPHMLMAFKNRAAHVKFECGKHINPSTIIFDGRKL